MKIKIHRLTVNFDLFKKDHRKWACWTWGHKTFHSWNRFYGLILRRRGFFLNFYYARNMHGDKLYNIEFVPKQGKWGRGRLPMWDTWRVKDEGVLKKRLSEYESEDYIPLQYVEMRTE